MQILDMLHSRRAEVVSEIEKLNAELAEIDKMLAAAGVAPGTVSRAAPSIQAPGTKDDAILQAIAAGNRTPAQIGQFMREKLGMQVNDASTRTRLSRMKSAEKIDHDSTGWKIK
jgi:hypothetical protein